MTTEVNGLTVNVSGTDKATVITVDTPADHVWVASEVDGQVRMILRPRKTSSSLRS